jgi:hypothetical protein
VNFCTTTKSFNYQDKTCELLLSAKLKVSTKNFKGCNILVKADFAAGKAEKKLLLLRKMSLLRTN